MNGKLKTPLFSGISKGKLLLAAATAALGAALIIYGGAISGDGDDGAEDEETSDAEAAISYYDDASLLEEEIAALCGRVDGVDDVFVMLTLDGDLSVNGVAVVCTGGNEISIKKTLTELISRALGIPISKISVAGASAGASAE
ncbi:MAG: hypothetical protein LUE25_04675 [Clostridiales bacterium]|nr:hypothetical protein [Clostridiales bacterium]